MSWIPNNVFCTTNLHIIEFLIFEGKPFKTIELVWETAHKAVQKHIQIMVHPVDPLIQVLVPKYCEVRLRWNQIYTCEDNWAKTSEYITSGNNPTPEMAFLEGNYKPKNICANQQLLTFHVLAAWVIHRPVPVLFFSNSIGVSNFPFSPQPTSNLGNSLAP